MVHAPAGKCFGQGALCLIMSKQRLRFARVQHTVETVCLRQRFDLGNGGRAGHQRGSFSNRSVMPLQIASATSCSSALASMSMHRWGSALAIAANASRSFW